MNNISNLGASQESPAIQGLAGQAATQGDNSSLFSALLMQRMGPDVSGAGDSGAMPDLGQGISGNPELAKLFQTMAAQAKNSASAMPPNRQTDNPVDDANGNPALAIWIAMAAAAQMQPNVPVSSAQLNGLSSQSLANGTEQNSALQTLEQQFPGLAQALKGSRLADAGAQAGKSSAQSTTGKTDFATPDLAKAEPDASTASNAAPTAGQQKNDAPQGAAPVHTDILAVPVIAAPVASVPTVATPAVSNAFAISDKGKVDQKDLAGIAAAKNSPGTVTPTASQNTSAQSLASQNVNSQNQGSDAKSQGQAPSGDGHSGNQSKKDSASATPSQQPANGDRATVTAADQTNFAAVAQAAAHTTSSSNSTSHTTSPAADQSLNVREVTGALGAEAAPRVVHAARLMEAAGQAEMRVSVKSDVSGTVDVRAVLEGGSISATVAAQHGGTRDWMMANMHELQNTFSRDDLNLKTFEVTDSALQNNGQGEQPGQQEQQQRNPAYANFMSEPLSPSTTSFDEVEAPETTSRALSLLA
jgi:hypothetical protein